MCIAVSIRTVSLIVKQNQSLPVYCFGKRHITLMNKTVSDVLLKQQYRLYEAQPEYVQDISNRLFLR